jgi:hypothetical protein
MAYSAVLPSRKRLDGQRNGMLKRQIFTGWMGENPMSSNRAMALLSILWNSGCAHVHLTERTLGNWIAKDVPIHPGFAFLSAVHRCDYLRAYLLHVHGGGYADVKHTTKDWNEYFALLDRSAAFGVGYTEVGPHAVARVGGALEDKLRANYAKLIGVCALVFRPRTEFTETWLGTIDALLDKNFEQLKRHPARHPQDRFGIEIDGIQSEYPLVWTGVGGDIFHPLVLKHADQILHADIAPSFADYR